jgi:hypothetical protein
MYVKSELLYSRLLIYIGLINIGRFVVLEGRAGHVGAVVIGLVLLPPEGRHRTRTSSTSSSAANWLYSSKKR